MTAWTPGAATSGYDLGLDKLQAFCSALRSARDALQAALPRLDAECGTLKQEEEDLREQVAALRTAAGALEDGASGGGRDAAKAADEVQSAARRLLDEQLPALQRDVDDSADHLSGVLTALEASLESQFSELQTGALDALAVVVEQVDAQFERWSGETDAATTPLLEDLAAAAELGARRTGEVTTELSLAADTLPRAELDMTSRLDKFDREPGDEVVSGCSAASATVAEAVAEWAEAMKAEAAATQNGFEDQAREAASALVDQDGAAAEAVQKAAAALETTDVEYEQAAADAQSWEPSVQATAALAPQVRTADGEVQEIKAALQGLEPS